MDATYGGPPTCTWVGGTDCSVDLACDLALIIDPWGPQGGVYVCVLCVVSGRLRERPRVNFGQGQVYESRCMLSHQLCFRRPLQGVYGEAHWRKPPGDPEEAGGSP